MGTELGLRGVDITGPAWSAAVLRHEPERVLEIHKDYARAGATVHTTNTFRTRRRDVGEDWKQLSRLAVQLARQGADPAHRVAASVSPLADCYRPDQSPPHCQLEHREFISYLATQPIDLFLLETFPAPQEALIAAQECVATKLPTWLSLTAGPAGDLLTPDEVLKTAQEALRIGVGAVLINCVDARKTGPYVEALATLGAPFGAYGNAGHPTTGLGWKNTDSGVDEYLTHASRWIRAGATLIGGCCGIRPQHIASLHRSLCAT